MVGAHELPPARFEQLDAVHVPLQFRAMSGADLHARITKLLALAASPNEHEARTAAFLAVKLIRENKVQLHIPTAGKSWLDEPLPPQTPPTPAHAAYPPPPRRASATPPRRHTYAKSSRYVCIDFCASSEETDKAVYVTSHYGRAWVAKTQIHASSGITKGEQKGTLVISIWLAEKLGWNDLAP